MSWTIGYQLQSRPYVVEEVLGKGGFGITYKVRHLEHNQYFVIKTPLDHIKNEPNSGEYLRRFQKEGEKLKRLCEAPHPHIVQVIDFFTEDENPCLVMEYIPGENLYQFVKRQGALTQTQALKVICQMADALNFMHQAELVHRDATPLNMMMRTPEDAVLIDFGIAKAINTATSTQTDMAGNRRFAPYEQVGKGSRQKTVDVYSLAASLYYAVTGKCATDSLDRKLCDQELVPPSQINPSISDRTNQAILKGMALEEKDRPQSIQEWLNLLEVEGVLTYRIRNSIKTVLEVFKILQQEGSQGMSRQKLRIRANRSASTINNIICDLQNFYMVNSQEDLVIVQQQLLDSENIDLANYLAKTLNQHIVIQRIYQQFKPNQSISLGYLKTLISEVFFNKKQVNTKSMEDENQSYLPGLIAHLGSDEKRINTKSVGDYISRMYEWLLFTGLLEKWSDGVFVIPVGEGKQKGKLEEETNIHQLELFTE